MYEVTIRTMSISREVADKRMEYEYYTKREREKMMVYAKKGEYF